jgi:uncharacterized protein (TIGR00251 family)
MAKITVQAHPGAKRNEVIRWVEGVWHIKIAAPPVEGKANEKLIDYLSEILGIPRSRITIEKGATGKRKLVGVVGLTDELARERL